MTDTYDPGSRFIIPPKEFAAEIAAIKIEAGASKGSCFPFMDGIVNCIQHRPLWVELYRSSFESNLSMSLERRYTFIICNEQQRVELLGILKERGYEERGLEDSDEFVEVFQVARLLGR